jgi:hypothetical protein
MQCRSLLIRAKPKKLTRNGAQFKGKFQGPEDQLALFSIVAGRQFMKTNNDIITKPTFRNHNLLPFFSHLRFFNTPTLHFHPNLLPNSLPHPPFGDASLTIHLQGVPLQSPSASSSSSISLRFSHLLAVSVSLSTLWNTPFS